MSYAATLPSLMGLGATTSSEINTGISTVGAGIAAGAEAGLLTTIGLTSAIVPIIGPVVAGVTLLIGMLGVGNGCGGTCTEATQVVNQVEPLMQQNLAAAQQAVQQTGCLTQQEQTQLIANFNSLWQQVVSNCGQIPAPGGTQCISDRKPGGKYDWTSYYLTPIKNMPMCKGTSNGDGTLTVSSVQAGGSSSGLSGLLGNPILLAAIGIGAVLLLKD